MLIHLPNELLNLIVEESIPEGFESLALTCKKLYTLCSPYLIRHNYLRARFTHFVSHPQSGDHPDPLETPFAVRGPSDLIACIAIQPVIARYIETVNLRYDQGSLERGWTRHADGVDIDHVNAEVTRLLQTSACLRSAGLDWADFRENIPLLGRRGDEALGYGRLSQHVTAFLITLLPNLREIVLPAHWGVDAPSSVSADASHQPPNKLIETMGHVARDCAARGPAESAPFHGLKAVTRLLGPGSVDLRNLEPYLSLPGMRTIAVQRCQAVTAGPDDEYEGLPIVSRRVIERWGSYIDQPRSVNFGESLVVAKFLTAFIDRTSMMWFLNHTPQLKVLFYQHSSENTFGSSTLPPAQPWDVCDFVNSVGHVVGDHLEELSVLRRIMSPAEHPLEPGLADLGKFRRLRRLEFELAMAVCNLRFLTNGHEGGEDSAEVQEWDDKFHGKFLTSLVPPTVEQLSICVQKSEALQEEALDLLFNGLSEVKESLLPQLRDVSIYRPKGIGEPFKRQCEMMMEECELAGVRFETLWCPRYSHLRQFGKIEPGAWLETRFRDFS